MSGHKHVRRICVAPSIVRRLLIVCATGAVFAGIPNVAGADPLLDQSFTGPTTAQAALGACCAYVGQTFSAGRTGVLAGVNVQVEADASNSLPLDTAIRGVDSSGLPNSTILAQTTLNSSSSFLDQLITFRQGVRVTAGTEYAIVVNYEGLPQGGLSGGWDGGLDNPYPRGTAVASSDYGVSWFSLAGLDLEFQTYVEPLQNPKAHHHHHHHRHHQHHRYHHHSARTAHA